jgi:hypothetical protein
LAILAAAILLLGFAAVVAAGQHARDDVAAELARQAHIRAGAEQRANAALALAFPASECVALEEARRRARSALDAAGLQRWQVGWDNDLMAGGCATYFMNLNNSPDSIWLAPRKSQDGSDPQWP